MRLFLMIAALAISYVDGQYVKSVKGNYGTKSFQHNDNMVNLFGNRTQNGTQYGYNDRRNYEVGVCYIEVPTSSLVRDPSHVPAGNGSRPDLSKIRTCCRGYIRNIHNFLICDPVCSNECVNGLCISPETCTCYLDYVKNEAGFCVATCPIGCQNGNCEGGECMCKQGYMLHHDGKYCVPICRGNCGSNGNCSAPNTCTCRSGYEATPDGSCKPHCTGCANGQCIGPNECRCQSGYYKDEKGDCKAHCERGCALNGICSTPNICIYPNGVTAPTGQEPTATTTSNNPHPNLQRPNQNYSNPSDKQSNYYIYPQYSQIPLPTTVYPIRYTNGSLVPYNQNPVYYAPSNPNRIPINPDNQILRPANSTQPNNLPTQYDYRQPDYTKPVNQLGQHPNSPLASYPRPSNDSSAKPYQPDAQHPQSPGQQGMFFNPYGGYYQPIFPGYPSNNYSYPSPNQPLYQGPLYPHMPSYNQHAPNQPGDKPQNSTNGPNMDSPNQAGSQPGNLNQPGYPYSQGGPYPQGNIYNQVFPNQPGYNQPGQPNYPNQPGQPGYSNQPNQQGYPNQPSQPGYHNQPGQPGYSNQPGQQVYPNQPGQPGYSNQPGEQGYPNQPNQPGYYNQPGQPGYYNQPGQQGYPNQPNQPGHHNQPGQPGYSNQPDHPYQPDNNQNPNGYYQQNTQVEYLVQPKYLNMTTYLKQDRPANGPTPQCSVPCNNAQCVEGNRCVCDIGYVALTDGSRCKPLCRGCFNGVCTAPNVCTCNDGYHMDTSIKGRKACVKRLRRSIPTEQKNPINVADLLVFEIPNEY